MGCQVVQSPSEVFFDWKHGITFDHMENDFLLENSCEVNTLLRTYIKLKRQVNRSIYLLVFDVLSGQAESFLAGGLGIYDLQSAV